MRVRMSRCLDTFPLTGSYRKDCVDNTFYHKESRWLAVLFPLTLVYPPEYVDKRFLYQESRCLAFLFPLIKVYPSNYVDNRFLFDQSSCLAGLSPPTGFSPKECVCVDNRVCVPEVVWENPGILGSA